jgi:hypothetical protein
MRMIFAENNLCVAYLSRPFIAIAYAGISNGASGKHADGSYGRTDLLRQSIHYQG